MTTPITTKYRTTNWSDYNAALKKRGSLLIWIDKDMVWYQKPTGKRGRSNTYSESAIQFCLTIKVLYNLGLRQTIGFVESLVKIANLDWSVPDYSTLSRRQKSLIVNIPARQNPNGLHLLVDSTGIKILGEGEWKTKKHGANYRRQWVKVHLGIDAETLEIRAIEVTSNQIGDAPMLPELLSQIPPNETIKQVTADGAYDTKACHEAIAERGAEAAIPVRKNGKPWKETSKGTQARNDALRATERFGYTLWKQLTGYHRRSLVETKMRCFKLLGERVMARNFDNQVAELQIRAAILNLFTFLGTPTTVAI
jgi:hypothetical protein